jgi:hypothetical protein
VNATTFPSEYVYTGLGVLVVVTGVAVVTGAAVVATATGAEVVVTGAAVAAGVADWGVLDVQPAMNAETSSSPQTILTRISVCAFDVCCMVIVPLHWNVCIAIR